MTLATISVGVGDKMAQEPRAYGANIRVVPNSESLSACGLGINPLKGRETLAEDDMPLIKDIFWCNNIIGFEPFLTADVEVSGAAGAAQRQPDRTATGPPTASRCPRRYLWPIALGRGSRHRPRPVVPAARMTGECRFGQLPPLPHSTENTAGSPR